jgi:hypothetical protein
MMRSSPAAAGFAAKLTTSHLLKEWGSSKLLQDRLGLGFKAGGLLIDISV